MPAIPACPEGAAAAAAVAPRPSSSTAAPTATGSQRGQVLARDQPSAARDASTAVDSAVTATMPSGSAQLPTSSVICGSPAARLHAYTPIAAAHVTITA